MGFKKSPQLHGARRTRVWHHHGSHTPTSPRTILLHSYYMSTQTVPPPVYNFVLQSALNFVNLKQQVVEDVV